MLDYYRCFGIHPKTLSISRKPKHFSISPLSWASVSNLMQDDAIHSAIPHRKPMLLVDKIVSQEEKSIHCTKTFEADEFFFQGHYPDFPLVPGVILCEAAMQAGAILVASVGDLDGKIPVLARLNEARFRRMVRPGETIDMNVEIDQTVSNAFYLSAKVTCEGENVVRFKFTCAAADRPTS